MRPILLFVSYSAPSLFDEKRKIQRPASSYCAELLAVHEMILLTVISNMSKHSAGGEHPTVGRFAGIQTCNALHTTIIFMTSSDCVLLKKKHSIPSLQVRLRTLWRSLFETTFLCHQCKAMDPTTTHRPGSRINDPYQGFPDHYTSHAQDFTCHIAASGSFRRLIPSLACLKQYVR
jgi:hypothetical protein